MSKGSSCCNRLVTVFRVIQFILSLAALACGIWIVYTMYSLSGSAHTIEGFIDQLLDPDQREQIEQSAGALWNDLPFDDSDLADFGTTLNLVLAPILHIIEGTPTRAIIISVAALWSLLLIIFLLYVHRYNAKHSDLSTNNGKALKRNRRWLRVCLSLLTLLLWIAALVCAILLVAEYGVTLFAGGAEMKLAWSAVRPLLKNALESAAMGDDHGILRSIDIVDYILTTGALAIVAVAASAVCGLVEIISFFVACCTSGKRKEQTRASVDSEKALFSKSPVVTYSVVESTMN